MNYFFKGERNFLKNKRKKRLKLNVLNQHGMISHCSNNIYGKM